MCIPAKRNGKGKKFKDGRSWIYVLHRFGGLFHPFSVYIHVYAYRYIYIYISLYMYIFFFLQINSRTVRKFDREKKCPRIHLNLKHWILFSNQFTYVLMNKFSKIKSMQNFQSQINFSVLIVSLTSFPFFLRFSFFSLNFRNSKTNWMNSEAKIRRIKQKLLVFFWFFYLFCYQNQAKREMLYSMYVKWFNQLHSNLTSAIRRLW